MEVLGDDLIYADKFLRDLFFKLGLAAIVSFLFGRFKIAHGFVFVLDLFFTDSEAFPSLSLSFQTFVLHADVEAFFIKITGRFVVVELLEPASDLLVLLEAAVNDAVAVVGLGFHENVGEPEEVFLRRFELFFLHLVQVLVVLQALVRFDGARCLDALVIGDIEEINESIQIALLHELDALAFAVNLVLQELVVFSLAQIGLASRHVLLMLGEAVS